MPTLNTDDLKGEQKEVVDLLRFYGAATLKDPMAKATVWEVMCKWDLIFTPTTAKNISLRKLRPQTIMFELGQDRVRYSHLTPLGQYLLERCPIWGTEDEQDIYWGQDRDGNSIRRVGLGGVMGDLRDGMTLDANMVAIRAEERLAMTIKRPEPFVPGGLVMHPKDYAAIVAEEGAEGVVTSRPIPKRPPGIYTDPTRAGSSITYENYEQDVLQSAQGHMVEAVRKEMDEQILRGLRSVTGQALPAHPAQQGMLSNVLNAAGIEIQESTDVMGRNEARLVDKITGKVLKTIRSLY